MLLNLAILWRMTACMSESDDDSSPHIDCIDYMKCNCGHQTLTLLSFLSQLAPGMSIQVHQQLLQQSWCHECVLCE